MPESNSSQAPENPYSAPQADVPARSIPIAYDQVPPQLNWKLTAMAWLIFFGGVALLLSVEHFMRSSRSDKKQFIPNSVWITAVWMLGMVALATLWRATKQLHSLLLRFVIVGCHAITGLTLYAFIILWYVFSTGAFKLI